MKIYKRQPEELVRLQIAKQGEETQYITLEDTTIAEVERICKMLISKQNLSPFEKGKVTSINMRYSLGGINGKSKSISFKGLSPKETLGIIVKHLS
jgi:hypothetical protein